MRVVRPRTACFVGPLVPAHFLKELGIAITVRLLGPQDVSEFEGLAVLLLGGLDVVLWRAEEEAVRNQVLGGERGWCRGGKGSAACGTTPSFCCAFGSIWAGFPQTWKTTLWAEWNQGPSLGVIWEMSPLCAERQSEALAARAAWLFRSLRKWLEGKGPRQHPGWGARPPCPHHHSAQQDVTVKTLAVPAAALQGQGLTLTHRRTELPLKLAPNREECFPTACHFTDKTA